MILVIGKENCSSCEMTKTILNNKGIEYEYKLLDGLENDEKTIYLSMARAEGKMSLPLIIDNNKFKTIQEVIA